MSAVFDGRKDDFSYDFSARDAPQMLRSNRNANRMIMYCCNISLNYYDPTSSREYLSRSV